MQLPPLEILPPGSSAWQPWLGAFETLRVERGRALFVEAHWQSLQHACAALGLRCATDFRRAADALPADATGRWRWLVCGVEGAARHFFNVEKFPRNPRPLALAISQVRVGSANLDARHKTLSYLAHWQARQEFPRGEALLMNEHGEIASAATTNIFWTRGNTLFTPDEACGCRAGVTRTWVVEHSPLPVRFVRAKPRALDRADEIFLTNSLLGISPVRRWRDREFPARSDSFVQRLRQKYRLACQAEPY